MKVKSLLALVLALCSFQVVGLGSASMAREIATAQAPRAARVSDWFAQYDNIRKEATMTEAERASSGRLLAAGVAASLVGQQSAADKTAAQALLKRMVDRYSKALTAMNALKAPPETAKLHKGYTTYFSTAACLFSDYLKIQNNLFATDANGKPILAQLQQRKMDLEHLDVDNKALDEILRGKYNIAPLQ